MITHGLLTFLILGTLHTAITLQPTSEVTSGHLSACAADDPCFRALRSEYGPWQESSTLASLVHSHWVLEPRSGGCRDFGMRRMGRPLVLTFLDLWRHPFDARRGRG